jgi:succinate dehydrogenase flavin-adding protein (antitoxin of CptAB toxin-antitoxin module)
MRRHNVANLTTNKRGNTVKLLEHPDMLLVPLAMGNRRMAP